MSEFIYSHVPYAAAFILSFYVHKFHIVLLVLLCHVCSCDACKCLHGFRICVWFLSKWIDDDWL